MSVLDGLSYALTELRENWSDGMWWRHRIGNRVIGPLHLGLYPGRNGSTYVSDADWDVLIVLDGCRADLFEAVVDTDRFDAYRRVASPGSKTPEWARENFAADDHGDTVYVASNGQVSKALGPTFHEMREVWRDTDGVPRPEDITAAARAAHEDHPDKRLVVHYLQPHRPFIVADDRFSEGYTDNPWQALAAGEVEFESVWDLYRENLAVVVDDAFELAAELPGRVVVTSDHGNLLGERTWPLPIRLFGHPGGVRHPALVTVPWAVIEADERPDVTSDGVGALDDADVDAVEDHLSDLGYL
jgi:hypothetical protein